MTVAAVLVLRRKINCSLRLWDNVGGTCSLSHIHTNKRGHCDANVMIRRADEPFLLHKQLHKLVVRLLCNNHCLLKTLLIVARL